MRWLAPLPLILAGCGSTGSRAPDPLASRPLREWRASGAASYRLVLNGRSLRFPDSGAVWCPRPGAQPSDLCTFSWSRRTGHVLGEAVGYHPERIETALYLSPPGTDGLFNMSRVHPDQWGGDGDQGPVRGRLAGSVDGHRYWVGCWRMRYPYSYGCSMTLDLGAGGAAVSEWELREPPGTAPYPLDHGRVERIGREVAAVRASFSEPPTR